MGGSPHINVSAKTAIDSDTLEYSLDGSPHWAVDDGAAPPATTFIPIVLVHITKTI